MSSPASQGSHALLYEDARLIRGPQDALDALYGVGARQPPEREIVLGPHLLEIRDQVGRGRDTLAKLTAAGCDAQEAVVALAELELAGAIVRGDGGRFLPRG